MGTQSAARQPEPFLGRDDELRRVGAALAEHGCLIVGDTGVGKSRLAAEAASRHGSSVLRVLATAAAGAVPFGAFAHLLAGVQVDARGPIAALVASLRQRPLGRPPILIVDDVHLLDPASSALVLAVAESGAARLLLTLRQGEGAPDAVTALWKDRLVERIDIGPLPRRAMRAFAEAQLGAPADAHVHARLFALTEGNPLYARELLTDAVRSGGLDEVDGMWRWTGKSVVLPRLSELVGAGTRDLGDEARLALELLALASPLSLDELRRHTDDDAVNELARAGIVTVHGEGGTMAVEFAHPLFGEVIAAELPPSVALAHRQRLVEVLARQPVDDPLALLRLATLRLETGAYEPDLFVRAASVALPIQAGVPGPGWDGGDAELALRLAEAAGPRLDAQLSAARARIVLGRFDEIEAHLAPLEAEARRARIDHAVDYLRQRVNGLHWSGRRTSDALALLDRATGWREEAAWTATVASLHAWILIDLGAPASARIPLRHALGRTDLPAPARLDLLLPLGVAESRLGRVGACEAMEAEIAALVAATEAAGFRTGWAGQLVDGLARAEHARDLDGTAGRLRAVRDRVEDAPPLGAALSVTLGRMALLRGHAEQSISLVEEGVTDLAAGDPQRALVYAHTYLGRALALAGDPQAAEVEVDRAASLASLRESHRWVHLEVARARAWLDAARGLVVRARSRLLEAAAQAGEATGLEAEIVYDAARFGAPAPPCAARLQALASEADSELLRACAAHVSGLARADWAAQLDAAERFAELGLDLYAAEAATRVVADRALAGREAQAARARGLAGGALARCGRVTTPVLALGPVAASLTMREWEVALLAARGHRNAEIADALTLSVRTVETYVLRACRKLGVARRAEMGALLLQHHGAGSAPLRRTPPPSEVS